MPIGGVPFDLGEFCFWKCFPVGSRSRFKYLSSVSQLIADFAQFHNYATTPSMLNKVLREIEWGLHPFNFKRIDHAEYRIFRADQYRENWIGSAAKID